MLLITINIAVSMLMYIILTISILHYTCNASQPLKKYYIYEWPHEFDDVYPPPDAKLDIETKYDHSFYANNGLGDIVDPSVGLFQTWQFSLYKNIMQRLNISSHRTYDPREASAFIIPLDAGVHSYIDEKDGKKRNGSPYGWRAINYLQDMLANATARDIYWKHHEHDHLILFGINIYQMIGVGVKMFYQHVCFNCSTLVIEGSASFTPNELLAQTLPKTYSTTSNTAAVVSSGWLYKNYYYSVPYPSSFHWHTAIQRLPWQPASTTTNTAIATTATTSSRPILSLFIGSVRTANMASNAFRRELHRQCLHYNNQTTVASSATSAMQPIGGCHWYPTAHACTGVFNASHTMLLFLQATFCPAPPGDSLTRKSPFDALLTSCIPVIFDQLSLGLYFWYFTSQELEDISVYIPKRAIMKEGKHFLFDYLSKITPVEIARKQAAIAKIAPTLQYSLAPLVHPGMRWDPPFRDAVDVLLDHLFDPATIQAESNFMRQFDHDGGLQMNATRKEEMLRQKCLHNEIVHRGTVYSRGLAWHKLRQLCLQVQIAINMEDGTITDLRDPEQVKEMKIHNKKLQQAKRAELQAKKKKLQLLKQQQKEQQQQQ